MRQRKAIVSTLRAARPTIKLIAVETEITDVGTHSDVGPGETNKNYAYHCRRRVSIHSASIRSHHHSFLDCSNLIRISTRTRAASISAREQRESKSHYDYSEFFTRPQKRMASELLREYREDIQPMVTSQADEKLEHLFSDSFSHHVTEYFGPGRKLTFLTPAVPLRLIADDNLSSAFISSYYTPRDVLVSDTVNTSRNDASPCTFDSAFDLISANPITSADFSTLKIGSNRITYLLGEQCQGKSILISRILYHSSGIVVLSTWLCRGRTAIHDAKNKNGGFYARSKRRYACSSSSRAIYRGTSSR